MKIGDFNLKQRKVNKGLVGRRAKRYVDENPKLAGVMDLYREIFSLQRKLSRKIPDQLPHIDGAQIDFRIEEGRLLVEPEELQVDIAVLKEMLRELGKALKEKGQEETAGLSEFLDKELDDDELGGLVDAFLNREDEVLSRHMERYSLDPTVFYMLLHLSLAPFYWKTAGVLARKADLDQVPRGTCPVCGDLPIMGFLRPEDGLRVLECSLCGSRWGIPRIMCPFCGNIDQGKLKYIFADDDDTHRAYLCDKCRKYIKISAAPGVGVEEFVVPLEDLATAHLDIAAEEREYERGCRTVFS